MAIHLNNMLLALNICLRAERASTSLCTQHTKINTKTVRYFPDNFSHGINTSACNKF